MEQLIRIVFRRGIPPRVRDELSVECGEHGSRSATSRGRHTRLRDGILLRHLIRHVALPLDGLDDLPLEGAGRASQYTRQFTSAWFIGFSPVSISSITSTSTWLRHEVRWVSRQSRRATVR